MGKSSTIGKKHVLNVGQALKESLAGNSIECFGETVTQTVHFIQHTYPNIDSVIGKYETNQPDASPDLKITLLNRKEVNINLFFIKGRATIQPKNLGAKSFLKKYFYSEGLQIYFNDFVKQEYELFLQRILSLKGDLAIYDRIPLLKRKIKNYYPKFHPDINPLRTQFLFNLREYCFELLKNEYNIGAKGIQYAFDELMMLKDTTIITRYTNKDKCLGVERWKSEIDGKKEIQIYKKGNDTIGIRAGNEALTLRFKFESDPTSSIKLATSYELFPEENTMAQKNLYSVRQFEKHLQKHVQLEKVKGKENAIGKCNEAMVYYRILKDNTTVNQVDEKEYRRMLTTYYDKVSSIDLEHIKKSSDTTAQRIYHYLRNKYKEYDIAEIQLVADSYLENRLDTSDLQLVLFVNQKYVIESFSLKAIAKRNLKITAKNPGAKQILGSTYFGIGSLSLVIDETERKFKEGLLDHRQSLEIVSAELGRILKEASQESLRRGVRNLLGNKPTIVTIYKENTSLLSEYDAIQDCIEVFPGTPTAIQTTLRWNRHQEELSLRFKFSAGQSHGWSSLKLSCDYRLNYNKV